MCELALSMLTIATPRDEVYQLHAYTSKSYFESFRINLAGATTLEGEMGSILRTQLEEGEYRPFVTISLSGRSQMRSV